MDDFVKLSQRQESLPVKILEPTEKSGSKQRKSAIRPFQWNGSQNWVNKP